MSHQRYPSSTEHAKEPHSVSLKVLRLARPSLVYQYPIQPPSLSSSSQPNSSSYSPAPASLAYASKKPTSLIDTSDGPSPSTNSDPFVLSPILNLPASFGSTYVGETFSCTLCANNDVHNPGDDPAVNAGNLAAPGARVAKKIRDVRIEAEMKTPTANAAQKLDLAGYLPPSDAAAEDGSTEPPPQPQQLPTAGVDLEPGQTLQRVVSFHLKEKGNHVLAVTVSYYEATETSGRTRTFRKLYQFLCKPALIVRTKVGSLSPLSVDEKKRRWVLEAQLENCSEEIVQLERVFLEMEQGLVYEDLNWEAVARAELEREKQKQQQKEEEAGGDAAKADAIAGADGGGINAERVANGVLRPLLHPGEIEQVCFVVSEEGEKSAVETDGRIMFGVMGVGWRGEMGSAGFLSTGRLGSRVGATS